MPRSKNKVATRAKRKKILKLAKGSFARRKNVYTVAKNSVEKVVHLETAEHYLDAKGETKTATGGRE